MKDEARVGRTRDTELSRRRQYDASADDGSRSGPPRDFLITLLSSTWPLDEVAARLPTTEFGTAFCERRVVDGRAHYRLHLGPFRTMDAAAQALRVARRIFPRAVICGVDGAASAGALGEVPSKDALAAQPTSRDTSGKVPGAVRASDLRAAMADRPATANEVIEIPDEHSPSKLYAVELLWSPDPLDLTHVPPLTLFDERTLYAVSVRRASHPWYGLRVGFYRDAQEARRAASELIGYFAGAIAVPATEQEFAQARAAEIRAWAARIDASVVVAA